MMFRRRLIFFSHLETIVLRQFRALFLRALVIPPRNLSHFFFIAGSCKCGGGPSTSITQLIRPGHSCFRLYALNQFAV